MSLRERNEKCLIRRDIMSAEETDRQTTYLATGGELAVVRGAAEDPHPES